MQRLLIPLILITLSAAVGCCSCRDAAGKAQLHRTVIHYSSGGGFSGMSSGYSILADGGVVRWKGHGHQREDTTRLGVIESEDLHRMHAAIYALDPASIRQQEPGNMTTALEIVSDDVVYTYTWPGVHTDANAVPATLKPLREIVWQQLQRFRSVSD
jgi:hypothetical protein